MYSGLWHASLRQGEGQETLPDGTHYRGQFHADRRHGYGSLLSPVTGITYEGLWRAGVPLECTHGWTLVYPNGDKYAGYAGARRDGDGGNPRSTTPPALRWSGRNGFVPLGYGVMRYGNGDVYSGEWEDGKRHGQGIFVSMAEAAEFIGEWRDDRMVTRKTVVDSGAIGPFKNIGPAGADASDSDAAGTGGGDASSADGGPGEGTERTLRRKSSLTMALTKSMMESKPIYDMGSADHQDHDDGGPDDDHARRRSSASGDHLRSPASSTKQSERLLLSVLGENSPGGNFDCLSSHLTEDHDEAQDAAEKALPDYERQALLLRKIMERSLSTSLTHLSGDDDEGGGSSGDKAVGLARSGSGSLSSSLANLVQSARAEQMMTRKERWKRRRELATKRLLPLEEDSDDSDGGVNGAGVNDRRRQSDANGDGDKAAGGSSPPTLQTYPNGDSFLGQIDPETLHREGYGVYLSAATGSSYSGEFLSDLKHGYGVLIHSQYGKYAGQFVRDNKEGMGTLILNDTSSYHGGFRDGTFHGRGTLCERDGTVYVGGWKWGLREGDGMETLADGR